MAGTQDRTLTTVAEAKARLLELGQRPAEPHTLLGNPIVRAGILLAGGALLGRAFRKRSKHAQPSKDQPTNSGTDPGQASPLRHIAMQLLLAAAPLLMKHIAESISKANAANKQHDPQTPT
ncbi:MAG: hypothetical protein ACK5TP_10270 [bacterium]